MSAVVLIGGPHNRARGHLARTPPRIQVARSCYGRVDDPDTERYLGAYVYAGRWSR